MSTPLEVFQQAFEENDLDRVIQLTQEIRNLASQEQLRRELEIQRESQIVIENLRFQELLEGINFDEPLIEDECLSLVEGINFDEEISTSPTSSTQEKYSKLIEGIDFDAEMSPFNAPEDNEIQDTSFPQQTTPISISPQPSTSYIQSNTFEIIPTQASTSDIQCESPTFDLSTSWNDILGEDLFVNIDIPEEVHYQALLDLEKFLDLTESEKEQSNEHEDSYNQEEKEEISPSKRKRKCNDREGLSAKRFHFDISSSFIQTGSGDNDDDDDENENLEDIPGFHVLPPIDNFFELELRNSRSFRQSNAVREVTYRAKPKSSVRGEPINYLLPHLQVLFANIIEHAKRGYSNQGVMRVYINHPNLQRPIIIPPTRLYLLDSETILQQVENVLYSAGMIPADSSIDISCGVVDMIQGSGRRAITNVKQDILAKKSFVTIQSEDNMCLPRSIVVGYSHMLAKENPNKEEYLQEYSKIRDHRRSLQTRKALELRSKAGLPDRAGTIEDVKIYESVLRVNIVVMTNLGKLALYEGCQKYDKTIYIYFTRKENEGHFDTITKINAVLNKQKFCPNCLKGFSDKTRHKCKVWCNVCGRLNCLEISNEKITCNHCNRTCRSKDCFEAHKSTKSKGRGKSKSLPTQSLCEQNWECKECNILLKQSERKAEHHECGETKCKICQEYFMENDHHICSLRAFTADNKPERIIYYDFECTQDEGKHIPNFVVAQSVCTKCESEPVTEDATCDQCGSRCNYCSKYNHKEKDWERPLCNGCGKRQVIFSGANTGNLFCEWLISAQHKNVTAIAHNARAYDAYFIYEYLMHNQIVPDPTIFNGSKIMYMRIGSGLNIRILDSLSFLPMPLASLPKSFGLEELKKGFFPHFFNTRENENTKLESLPDKKYYDPDSMSTSRRKEFLEWYERHKDKAFDFQKEMREYCISDVDILLKACCKFRKLLKSVTSDEWSEEGVDPYSYLTIASVCMGVYKSKFLHENWQVILENDATENCAHDFNCKCVWRKARKLTASTPLEIWHESNWSPETNFKIVKRKFVSSPIGLIPSHGYSGSDKHSVQSMEWLYTYQKEHNVENMQHARSPSGEKIILCQGIQGLVRYKADGYYEKDGKKIVLEFNGCSFHGCRSCYPEKREITMNNGKSMGQRYRETALKEKRLRNAGYEVISKWSCEWVNERKTPRIKEFIESKAIDLPINIRDAYFGGRTNALVLHKIFSGNEKGYYVDFTSLYPDVLKYRKFPVYHPQRIIDEFLPCEKTQCDGNCFYSPCDGYHWSLPYFGIIKATFKPPSNLLHPVLPVRYDGKLKFPLCNKCAAEQQDNCSCNDSERSFTHTYCTPEVEVAINMGYEIVKIHEVLHWPESEVYDPSLKTGGLFTEYVNTFLKLKQESSGFPEHVQTEEDKDTYIRNYLEHEGILLDKDMIQKNPGLRSLSKLALNSFYGKFGQKTNMKKTKFITDIAELSKLFTDPSKKMSDFHLMSQDIVAVEFKDTEDFESLSSNTNAVIAAFCTSWARLKLWSVMNKLGERVLYHDTDSIIFSVKNDQEYIPPLGEYLGELTNELTCKELGCKLTNCSGHWIVEFVSCGPKNYSYKTNTGEVVCKVRGFSLNFQNSQIINFETMKKCLYAWKKKEPLDILTIKTELVRNKHDPQVVTKRICKKYGVVYDKRTVLDDLTTRPFGYKL